MKMPNFKNANVHKSKITDYLLSETHPVGRYKARFWLKFGFSPSHHKELMDAFRKHAYNDYVKMEKTGFGTRYVIEAPLISLDGRNPFVRSIWFVDYDESPPSLVTAYPVGESIK